MGGNNVNKLKVTDQYAIVPYPNFYGEQQSSDYNGISFIVWESITSRVKRKSHENHNTLMKFIFTSNNYAKYPKLISL